VNRELPLDGARDYRTKVTLGITGWYCLRVQIDGSVRHLDVGSSYPGAGEGPKGLAVRQLKRYASWVQTVYTLNECDVCPIEYIEQRIILTLECESI
jgi:hypothetical protein